MRKSPALYRMGLVVAVIALSLVAHIPGYASQPPLMKPAEAFALIQKNKGNSQFVVVDVRTPEEFRQGHIKGAVNINLNSNVFRDKIETLNRQTTYLVYCRSGRRSKEAVQIMQNLGFTHILLFQGDMLGRRAEKLPIVK